MKKLTTTFIALALCLAACGKSNDNNNSANKTNSPEFQKALAEANARNEKLNAVEKELKAQGIDISVSAEKAKPSVEKMNAAELVVARAKLTTYVNDATTSLELLKKDNVTVGIRGAQVKTATILKMQTQIKNASAILKDVEARMGAMNIPVIVQPADAPASSADVIETVPVPEIPTVPTTEGADET